MNNRRTLATELGVFETFTPQLPASYRNAKFVLLANIAPSLQSHVLTQMRRPKFVVADTMDLWLNIAMPDLLQLLKKWTASCSTTAKRANSLVIATCFLAQKNPQTRPQIPSSSKKASTARFSPKKWPVPFRRISAASRGGSHRRG